MMYRRSVSHGNTAYGPHMIAPASAIKVGVTAAVSSHVHIKPAGSFVEELNPVDGIQQILRSNSHEMITSSQHQTALRQTSGPTKKLCFFFFLNNVGQER